MIPAAEIYSININNDDAGISPLYKLHTGMYFEWIENVCNVVRFPLQLMAILPWKCVQIKHAIIDFTDLF